MPLSLAPEQWAFIALVALPLTLVTSVILLWMYRRALLAAMSASAGPQSPAAFCGIGNSATAEAGPASLRIMTVREALTAGRNSTLGAVASARLRRALLAYVFAGFSQAIVGACMWLLLSKTGGFMAATVR
jgi:hypothetical protein